MSKCHFIHANGFPPDAYKSLLSLLDPKYELESTLLRSLWDEKGDIDSVHNWDIFLNDFLNECNITKTEKGIGIGHSIGGNIIIRAAIKNPNLFNSIILLDPTIFHPSIIAIAKVLNFLDLFKYTHPYALAARKRRESYDSYEEIFKSYKKKKIFSKIEEQQLEEYINSIFKKNGDRYELIYDKRWEEVIYLKAALKDNNIWHNLDSIRIPTLIIRPDINPVLKDMALKKIEKNKFVEVKIMKGTTHLFPLEFPEKTSQIIFDFLSRNK